MELLMEVPVEKLALLIPIVVVVGLTTVGLVAVGGFHYRKHRQLDIEAALKAEMLERGMSAEDIERVLRASSQIENRRRRCAPRFHAHS